MRQTGVDTTSSPPTSTPASQRRPDSCIGRWSEVYPLTESYDEIQVFEGIAERTGASHDRSTVRGRPGICRSITALAATARRLGDGFYFLSAGAWPEGCEKVDLNRPWSSMASLTPP